MTNLLLTISGAGGGSKGPQGIYPLLGQLFQESSIDVISVDTIRDDANGTINRVASIAEESFSAYDGIYLMGYSMGGGVAACAAHRINQLAPGKVKGVCLLATQTDGLGALLELDIPTLFYVGENEQYFPERELDSVFKRLKAKKKMIIVDNLDHSLRAESSCFRRNTRCTEKLAGNVFDEFSTFFLQSSSEATSLKIKSSAFQTKSPLNSLFQSFLSLCTLNP